MHHLPLSKGSGLPSFKGGYLLNVSAQVSGSCLGPLLPHQMLRSRGRLGPGMGWHVEAFVVVVFGQGQMFTLGRVRA